MKLFKKSVSVFLAILMIFGSVSLLATAADAEYNWEIDTKFYRYDGTEWVETTKAARGEPVKARVFVKTDFQLGPTDLFFFYPTEFLTHDTTNYSAGSNAGSYMINFNSDTTNPVGANAYSGELTYGTDNSGQFANMVDWEYLTEADLEGKGWLFANIFGAQESIVLDGKNWLFELDFTVNETATEKGQFYLSTECISDYDLWMAATVISANPDNDGDFANYYSSCDEAYLGEFGYTLKDTDEDSSLSCDNNVIFTTTTGTISGTAEYTGYIGNKLSTISGFSLPTASADGKQFLGWSTDGSTVLTNDQIKELTIGYETLNLKAVFQAAEATYKQNIYTMGTDGEYPETAETSNIGASTGATVNVSTYSVPAGFTLDTANSTAGDVTVTADGAAALDIYLKRDQYKATFGEASSDDVYYGADYAAPAGPAKEGYAFAGWKNGDVLLQEGDTATMGLADVTYTATYTPAANVANIVINYVDQKSGEAATKTVEIATVTENTVTITEAAEAGDKVTNILFSDERLALEHYKLNTEAANETSEVVAADGSTVLNLYYIPEQYTATFAGADSVTGDYYALKNAPAGPDKDGETFLGWSLDNKTVALTAGQEFRLEGNAAYTALYEATDYTVTYVFSGTAPAGVDPSVYSTTANMGDAVELPEMSAEGWTFNGWTVTGAVAGDAAGEYKVGTSNVTVTGTWTKNTYVVNFWLDDEMTELYDSQEYSFGAAVTTPDAPADELLPTPGTTFVKWDKEVAAINADAVSMYFIEDDDETTVGVYVCNITASVSDIEYTVTVKYVNVKGYIDDSETAEDESIVATFEGFYYGDEITADDLAEFESVEGYDFVEWRITGATAAQFPYTVTGDVTVRGYFNIQKYNAIFHANDVGETGGAWLNGDTERTVEVEYGAQITAPSEDPIRTGYTLDTMKWAPELGTMFTEDQDFYAVWIANTYKITFVVEGTSTESTQTYGKKLAVPAEVVTDGVKEGYTFSGWTADGGATVIADITTVDVPAADTTYTAVYVPSEGGVDYTVNRYLMDTDGNYGSTPTETFTLHAVAETKITYAEKISGFELDTELGDLTITVAGDGSSVINAYYARNKVTVDVNGDKDEYFQGEEIDLPDAPEKEGESFDHWEDENGNTITDPYVVPNEEDKEVILTPVYTKNEYTATFIISAEGTSVTYTTTKADYESPVVAPADPTESDVPAGYVFKGWAKTEGATEALTDLGSMPVNGITFYAVLESKTDVKYNIEKYFMGTDGTTYTLDAAKSETKYDGVAGKETTLTLAADEYEGFTLNTAHADSVLTAVVKGNGTTTFKAYYDRNTVKVTINGEEEEKYYGEEITEDDMPDHPEAPEGMEPDGWVDENGDPVEFPIEVGTEDIVLEPNYKASEFEITFMNGTETVQSGKQTYGEVLAVPADPSLAGHSFDGWYAGDVKVVAGTTTVPATATTYTAKFTALNYTVTFIADGETVQTGEYAFGTKISTIVPAYTAPSGYEFGGWSTDGSTKVEFTDDVTVPVDGVTYHAILTPASGTAYTVETYVMNPTGVGYAKSSETKYDVTDTVINYQPADKTGFTVNGEKSVLTGTVTGDGKMVIKVFYDRIKVKVTIDGVEGEYYYGSEIEQEDPTPDEGYTFEGWVDDESNTVTFPMTVPAEDIEITPVYKPIKYTVTFKIKGQIYATGEYDFGSAIVNPGDPTEAQIAGYTFGGWSKDGNTAVNLATETVPVDGITYTALLTAKTDTAYTVKKVFQNTDGLTWGEPVDDVRYGKTGDTVTLVAEDEAVTGFEVYEIEPATVTIAGNGSTVIYIYYTRNTVSVTINGDKDDYYYGETIEEPEEPSKDGYTFGGWEDEDGNPVNFPITVPEKDLVITPVFDANTVSLSFEVDGVVVEGYPVDVEVDSTITAPTAPKKEGYNFVDWYIKGTNTAFNGTMPTTNTVYEARYTAGANTKVAIEIYTMNTEGNYEKTVAYTFGVTDTTAWVEPNTDLTGLTPNLEKSVLSGVVAADGSTVLSIYYDRDLYEVTWIVDGVETTDDVYYGAEIVAPADPAKDGYTFAGWTPEVPATMPESDLEFTATWAEAAYTVTYVVNGEKTTETYKYGATVTVMDAPEVEGMTFDGWFDGETEYVAGSTFTMPNKNLIIVADFSTGIYKVTFLDATGAVFATEMVKFGDEIPVPESEPTKEHYEFKNWNIIYDTMPAMNITVEPVFERIPVKLIPMAGSTTIIDRDINVITGLREYILSEDILRNSYLDVEGDGFFTVTPVDVKCYGTGTKVELYDNLDPTTPIETYVIVIYGDINGDSIAQAIDSTYADDEGLMLTNWSEETVYDEATGTMVANPNYDPYKVMAADLNGDGIIDATDATIIGDATIGMIVINQVTGRPA